MVNAAMYGLAYALKTKCLGRRWGNLDETVHCRWQLAHMADQPIRLEFRDRNIGVAKFDPDDGDGRPPGDADVRAGVPDHDGRGQLPAGARHRLLQDDGIGLGDAERVGAADRGKSAAQAELVEQAL